METVVSVFTSLGFPAAICVVMGWFIYYIYKNFTEQTAANMKQVQERCAAREEKLCDMLNYQQETNRKSVETIALYAERMDSIEDSVKEIKGDIAIIKERTV